MAVPFNRAAGLDTSGMPNKVPGLVRSVAGPGDRQGFTGASTSADMLGSQANETVLVQQPQAYITQKARVKRNRRTEWDYYVQFPGFPEDEGSWYSARAIKTQHPRGAELIREFEHPNDSPEPSPQPSLHQRQPAQLTGPQTQDAGPSQISSQALYSADGYSSYQQPYTQDFTSQLQQPVDHMLASASATRPTLHMQQVHVLQAPPPHGGFNTASQNDLPMPLHWSIDRLQQSAQYKPQQMLQPSAQSFDLHAPQLQSSSGQLLPSLPRPLPQPQASMLQPHPGVLQPQVHVQGFKQSVKHDQTAFAQMQALEARHKRDWRTGQQSHWQQPMHFAQGQAVPVVSGPQAASYPTLPSSTAHPQQSMKQFAAYLPFQQQQQQLAFSQQASQPQGLAQHPVQANQAARPADGQPEAQELPQPGFTPAAGFQLPSQAQQHLMGPQPSARQADLANQPSHEPAKAAHEHYADQPTVETQKGVADSSLHGTTTSDVLGQQANQWRQAARKRSALADLVPAVAKPAASQHTGQGVLTMAQSQGQLQLSTAQQGCEAFKPAVQACIAAASLPLAKPFYQQAVERAMEQRTQRHAVPQRTEANSIDGLKKESTDANANDHSTAEVPGVVQHAASVAHDTGHEQSGGQNAAQQGMPGQQPQSSSQLEAASPVLSDESDLGTDLADGDSRREAGRHISANQWGTALICGARRVGESLELHIKWKDGYDAWMSLEALKKRKHCQSAIIDFLVSKVRKKTKG